MRKLIKYPIVIILLILIYNLPQSDNTPQIPEYNLVGTADRDDELRERYLGERVLKLEWHPHAPMIAVGYTNGIIRLWDTTRSEVLLNYNFTHDGNITALSWNPEGTILISTSIDKSIRIWDIENKKLMKQIQETASIPLSVNWSPDGSFFVVGYNNGTITVRDRNYHIIASYTLQGIVYDVDWSPSGEFIASISSDGSLLVWEETFFIANGSIYKEFEIETPVGKSLAWSPDSNKIAYGSGLLTSVLNINNETSEIVESNQYAGWFSSPVNSISWHPKENVIISCHSFDETSITSCIIKDITLDVVLTTIDRHQVQAITDVAWNPNNYTLAIGRNDGTVEIYTYYLIEYPAISDISKGNNYALFIFALSIMIIYEISDSYYSRRRGKQIVNTQDNLYPEK